MSDARLRIDVPETNASVSALRTDAPAARWLFVYAPGAGSDLHDPFGAFAAKTLAARGVATLRFQFLYMEAGRRGPDRPAVLEAAWRAVLDAAGDDRRVVAGGRSMGGRIASQVAAAGAPVDALALFAYPLHPPGRPDQTRDAHLPSLPAPVLFCSGTNDAFASPDELRAAAAKVPRATVHLLEGADHGFAVRKASVRTRDDVWSEAVEAMLQWLGGLQAAGRPTRTSGRRR